MNKKDVSPSGWSGTTKAMKEHPEIDNPFALAWWMEGQGMESHKAADDDDKHDDDGPEFEPPRMTGHVGSAYVYGQRRGTTPDPLDFDPLAVAYGEQGWSNVADDKHDDDDVKALRKAMDDEDASRLYDLYDSDDGDGASHEALSAPPSTRGHATFGGAGAQHASAADDGDEDEDFEHAGFDDGAHEQVCAAGHHGTGGETVHDDDDVKHSDDDDDDRSDDCSDAKHADDDDEDHDDDGMSPPPSDPATVMEEAQAALERGMTGTLNPGAQPPLGDPAVKASPYGTSTGAIADVPVVGWK